MKLVNVIGHFRSTDQIRKKIEGKKVVLVNVIGHFRSTDQIRKKTEGKKVDHNRSHRNRMYSLRSKPEPQTSQSYEVEEPPQE